jgi:rod shape-determining protein MreD
MNAYLTIAGLIVLAILQSTVMPRITVLGVHPDLVLLVVTSWSLLRGAQEGMLWALVGGIAVDLFSGAPFGVITLSLLVTSFLSSLGQRNVFRLDLLIPIVVIPLATLVQNTIMLTLLWALQWPTDWGAGFAHVILPAMLVNTIGMPLVYLALRALDQHVGREVMAW